MNTLLGFITWNVNPVAFSLGSIEVRWYGILLATGFVLAYVTLQKIFKTENLSQKLLDRFAIWTIVWCIVGLRLGHFLFYEPEYLIHHPLQVFLPIDENWKFIGYQGLASHGAAIAILLVLWLYNHRYHINVLWVLDRIVIVVALGGAFIRLGNLFNSEIYGVETSLPWGFVFERNHETVAKHPTQLYESLSYFIIFGVSLWYYLHKKGQFKTGTIFGWWLVALFGARFLIEFVKTNGVIEGSILLKGQWLSIPFILGGLVIAWLAHKEKLSQGAFPNGEKRPAKEDPKKK